MRRAHWWLVDKLARALERDEREAVCGDFAETDDTGARALGSLLGLVVRRQVALWMDWRPWLTLAALVVPLGVLLNLVSVRAATGSAIPIWMILDNWTMTFLESPGARSLLVNNGINILSEYLALACWSWAAGLMLGALSRRAIPVIGIVFGLVVLFARLLSPLGPPGGQGPNAAVFSLTFYSVVFPLILQVVLVVLPSVWGIRQGLRLAAKPQLLRGFLLAFVFTTLVVLVFRNWGWILCSWGSRQACMEWLLWAGYVRRAGVPPVWQMPTLPLTLIGPVGYAVATGIWRRWRGQTAPA